MPHGSAIAAAVDRRREIMKPYDDGMSDSAGIPVTLRELIANPTPFARPYGENGECSDTHGGNLGWQLGDRYVRQLDGQSGRPCPRPVGAGDIPDRSKRPRGPVKGGEDEHLHLGVLARACHEWMLLEGIEPDIDHSLLDHPWPVLAYLVDTLETLGFPEQVYFPQEHWAWQTGEWWDPAMGSLPVYDLGEWETAEEFAVIDFLADLHAAMHGCGRPPSLPESALGFTVRAGGRVVVRGALAPRGLIDRAEEALQNLVAGEHRNRLRRPWPAALKAMSECSLDYLAVHGDMMVDITLPLTTGEEVQRFVGLCREVAGVRRHTDDLVRMAARKGLPAFWGRLIEDLLTIGEGEQPCGT